MSKLTGPGAGPCARPILVTVILGVVVAQPVVDVDQEPVGNAMTTIVVENEIIEPAPASWSPPW